MKVHVAIQMSHRIECLNLFLDIVKNNFTNHQFITHVFCNLSEKDLEIYKTKIDFSLVDYFHSVPDDCEMTKNRWHDYQTKLKHKNEQPLRLFKNILSIMSKKEDVEKFIYTEVDVFPLVEEKYVEYYKKIVHDEMYAFYNDTKLVSPKTPKGFFLPGPAYISKQSAAKLSEEIPEPVKSYPPISFEGIVLMFIKSSKVNLLQINEFCKNFIISERNRCSITESTHQHNLFNLRNTFKELGINKGKWVKQVLEDERIFEIYSNSYMEFDPNFKLEYWDLENDFKKYWHK